MVPMAELHCHVEGAASPDLVLEQARKYGRSTDAFIRDGAFVWHDFTSFLAVYDFSAGLFRTEEDYALLAEQYLTGLAGDGAIYSEVFTSPDHAERAGLSPQAYTDALGEGMARAKAATGIEGRMIVTGVRHFGIDSVEEAARFAATCGHPLVTGFGMAGDERFGDTADYARAFEIAREAGLGITVHAGEFAGWRSVAATLDHLRPSRIGHGVRAIENPDLVKRIADEGAVLEVCPVSNIELGVFADFAGHPFAALRAAGCKVTLNSDDPPYFRTSLKREYDVAAEHFGMRQDELLSLTRTALEAAFVDEPTRARLLARCDVAGAETPAPVPGTLLDTSMRQRVAAMYRAADRHYHSMSHVGDLLALADLHADLVSDVPVMEAAIWFHDAILDTHRNDNEARSADLARKWLAGDADPARIERVGVMIEATASHAVPADLPPDLREQVVLFLDMDLSILGAEPTRFDAYEAAVRREYAWVSGDAWRSGRAQVLRRFLDRPAIFATPRFRMAYESAARSNLARSLSKLQR